MLPLLKRWPLIVAVLVLAAGCGGSRRQPAGAGTTPPLVPASMTLQELFEAGRYGEVLGAVPDDSTDADLLWLAAHAHIRTGRRDEAQRRFQRMHDVASDAGRRAAATLALAMLSDDEAAIDAARSAAAGYRDDAYAQFELGLAGARRNDFGAAAQAFDRCAEVQPRFAYAYYNAALAYDRLNRADQAVIRLETFQRLAPQAPERPEVEALLRTVRARR